MKPGATFRFLVEPYHHAIVVAECPHDCVLVVRLTTPARGKEETCWVRSDEYRELKYASLVNFEDAFCGARTKVAALVEQGNVKVESPVTPKTVDRICRAVQHSRAKRDVKRWLDARPNCCDRGEAK